MTTCFHFIGAMTLVLVLGGCASREPGLEPPSGLLKPNLATIGAGTSLDVGSTSGTAANGSAIPESVAQEPLPSMAPQSLQSRTKGSQNQMLDRPQNQPSSIQSDPGSPGPGARPNGDTITALTSQQDSSKNDNDGTSSFGQLSYPTTMERQLTKTP